MVTGQVTWKSSCQKSFHLEWQLDCKPAMWLGKIGHPEGQLSCQFKLWILLMSMATKVVTAWSAASREYHASWYSFLSVLSIMKCTFWWFSLVHQEVIPLENYWPVERNKKANGSSSQENRRMTHINLEVIQKPQTLLCLVSLQVQPRLVIGIFYVWPGALKKRKKY